MGRIFEALQRSGTARDAAMPSTSVFEPAADTLRSVDADTTELDRVPSVKVMPSPERRLVTLSAQRNLGAEKIRILAARLMQLQERHATKTILITSSVKDEGKSVLSANLAISLARTRQRVLLVDGDCHHSSATALFGPDGSQGLTDWWLSDKSVLDYLLRINQLPLWLLPAGGTVEHSLEMLQSDRLSEMLAQVNNWFQWIIVDSPPCAPLADASVWGSRADGILLVTRNGKTPKRLLKKVLDSLDRKKLVGVVLNDCTDPDQSYYTQYYNLHKKN